MGERVGKGGYFQRKTEVLGEKIDLVLVMVIP
jgi:hypothetical protein